MLESLRGVYSLETHYLRRFEGRHYREVVSVLGRPPNHIIGGLELLFALPKVLNQVDFGVHEAHHLCHLSEDIGQLIGNFLMEDWQMSPKIGLPCMLNQVQVLEEGLPMGAPQVFCQRIFLSTFIGVALWDNLVPPHVQVSVVA